MLMLVIALLSQEPLYVASPLTRAGAFTDGIEGPACVPDGGVFAVNFERQQTIGRVTADGDATPWLSAAPPDRALIAGPMQPT